MRMDSCMSITVGKQLSVSGNKFRGSLDERILRNNSMGVR